jgi:MFS family permease
LASVEPAISIPGVGLDEPASTIGNHRRFGGSFWRLWCATGISATGDGLVAVALPLLAYSLAPHDPLAVSGVTAASTAAVAAAALPAGLVADRVERRRLMTGCNLVSGVALFLMVVVLTLSRGDLAAVYVVAALVAAADVTYTLAMQASVPDVIVRSDLLSSANGRLIAIEGAGEQFLGPGCGGILFALVR